MLIIYWYFTIGIYMYKTNIYIYYIYIYYFMLFVICYVLKTPKVFPKVNKSATWSHLLPGVLFSYLTRSPASSAMVLKRKNPLWPLWRIFRVIHLGNECRLSSSIANFLLFSFCSPSAESFGWCSWAFKFPAVGGAQIFSSWWDHPLDPEDVP